MSSESEDSFSSFQADFDRLTDLLKMFATDVDALGSNLEKMQKPLENIEIAQLSDTVYLEQSPFRSKTFLLKSEFSGIDITQRHSFQKICSLLRTYLFQHNMVSADGKIVLIKPLQTLFDIQEPATYLDLIGKLQRIIL
jgi:hypothetical protein